MSENQWEKVKGRKSGKVEGSGAEEKLGKMNGTKERMYIGIKRLRYPVIELYNKRRKTLEQNSKVSDVPDRQGRLKVTSPHCSHSNFEDESCITIQILLG